MCKQFDMQAAVSFSVKNLVFIKPPNTASRKSTGMATNPVHKHLDQAVFAAYGWKSDLSDEEILERLLALNLERAKG